MKHPDVRTSQTKISYLPCHWPVRLWPWGLKCLWSISPPSWLSHPGIRRSMAWRGSPSSERLARTRVSTIGAGHSSQRAPSRWAGLVRSCARMSSKSALWPGHRRKRPSPPQWGRQGLAGSWGRWGQSLHRRWRHAESSWVQGLREKDKFFSFGN